MEQVFYHIDVSEIPTSLDAPMTAAAATEVILDDVNARRWRILVGDDARLDERVCQAPRQAYDAAFYENFAEVGGWRPG
ncbi:hypothetical protein GALL_408490 [mine drainage metagenome]|uniref:Uncharacterized protein n=1 Tax=mine drainage metagenome TaxID=410659 RepID=A0A1J5Q161_9ZZZZ